MANRWHKFIGGVLDGFRMAWALPYWNFRKTIFRLGGRRGYVPCHDHTDDNMAGCMRCNAVLHWAEPGRLRRVCPLLHLDPKGWRCSVASSGVRTYWGRFLGWYGATLFSIYLLGALLLWLTLQLTGTTRIGVLQVVWPGSWHRVSEVPAEDFFSKSIMAFRSGRLGEAYVALNSTCMQNPDNYDAKLMLAQISGAAMWVTGLICDAPLESRQWQSMGVQLFGDTYPVIDRVDLKSSRMDSEASVIFLINVLTLPRELIFTLLAKVNSEKLKPGSGEKRALRRLHG